MLLPRPPLSPPGKVTVLPRQVLPPETLLPLWRLYRQTVRPGKEALLPRLVLSLLGKTTVCPRQVPLSIPGRLAPLRQLLSFQWKEVVPPRLLLSFHQRKAAAHPIPLALPKQVKSAILPVLLGKAIGAPPRYRSTQAPQEVNTTSCKCNTPSTPLLDLPRVLLWKDLSLHEPSTSPTNL